MTFRAMNKDPRVMAFFPSTLTDSETDSFYNRIEAEFEKYGYGLFEAEVKESGEFIGFIGFHWAVFKAEFTPCIEIGWRLKFEAWGLGYATEGAKACLKHGFEKLGFDKVYSFTSKLNIRSENVMKKIGMKKAMEFAHPNIDEGNPLKQHVQYEITSACWRSASETGNN